MGQRYKITDLTIWTMNETIKTSIFIFFAVILVAGAFFSRPALHEFRTEELIGQFLFPQFTDPIAIKSLEIVKLDVTGERSDFRVVEINGIWSIPSHDNYPADARDQMGRVAEALTGLTVLEIIQPDESGIDMIAFQTQYGVIDPSSDNILITDGVGTKITLGGANNTTLVNLIIGKEAARRQADESEINLRYVRVANQIPVYVIDINTSQFTTSFDQWIEKNLLDISTFDIGEIFVDEYSFSVEFILTNLGLRENPRASFIGDIILGYDGSAIGADKWSLIRWMTFERQNDDYREQQLGPDKELDIDKLDAMIAALNDLKIVSVLKKPTELASALREGTLLEDIEMTLMIQESMQQTGFWLVEMIDLKGDAQQTRTQLLSNEGDIQLRLKNGIVYNLRFGNLTGTESEVPLKQFGFPHSPNTATKMVSNRYLFITAEFNPMIIPLPELHPLPEDQEEMETVKRANQREQERYDTAIESGKKRVAELSDRFADWYYIISDDVYKRIRLTEENVFRIATPDSEPSWGKNILDGIDLQSILGTPPPADHLPDSPEMEGLDLDAIEINEQLSDEERMIQGSLKN